MSPADAASGAAPARSRIVFCHGSDRKSTRLNSSHPSISYAVFCLKKKNWLDLQTVHWRGVEQLSAIEHDDTGACATTVNGEPADVITVTVYPDYSGALFSTDIRLTDYARMHDEYAHALQRGAVSRRTLVAAVGREDLSGLPGRARTFFFNDTATTEIYTLSLHDALPI